jgi:hypothetical protein
MSEGDTPSPERKVPREAGEHGVGLSWGLEVGEHLGVLDGLVLGDAGGA